MAAARKRSSRSPKRSTKRKSGSGSSAPVLALGAILALGAFSLWATTQHRSPQAALTALFQRPAAKPASPSSAPAPAAKVESKRSVETAPAAKKEAAKDFAAAVGPIPRPSAPVAPAASKPVQQAAMQMPAPPMPMQKLEPIIRPPAAPVTARALPLPPRGTNAPAHSPSVIHARVRLTIHKNAWDKSPAIGTVEKGREMRSYGKTGRWHRVVVPSTNMIGWVHEDQLIGGRNKPDSASMITGSVSKKPQAAKPAQAAKSSVQPRIQPPLAVGQKN